jgi:hypothetical protein
MKQLMIISMVLLVSVVSAHAQMDGSMRCAHEAHAGQGMTMEECQHMPMMQHMMKNKMMMQEIQQMMKVR